MLDSNPLEAFDAYPSVTEDLPGIGGHLSGDPAEFVVEEVPAYLPSGEGEHLYLFVEKVGQTTVALLETLRDEGGIPEAEIGSAGLKDKRAVTRQWLSVPRRFADRVHVLEQLEGVRILETRPHRNKLRTGHLRGNRFRVVVREPERGADTAAAILSALAERGVPNYYGPQRFGVSGENPAKGLAVLRGRRLGYRWLERFLVSSLQSLLFNEWAAARLRAGLFDRFLVGDVAKKHDTGGEFVVEDPEQERPRAQRLEISPTGPIFGRRYREAVADARAFEDAILARAGVSRDEFRSRRGARRLLRVPLADWRAEPVPGGVALEFFLPKGAYATSLLREVMKAPLATRALPGEDEGIEDATSGPD